MKEKNNNEGIDTIISKYIVKAKDQFHQTFDNTDYANYVEDLTDYYKDYLITGIKLGFINQENIDLFLINNVVLSEGPAYASWGNHTLTIQYPRFFDERTKEEQRNVIYHELTHSLVNELIDNTKDIHGIELSQNLRNFLVTMIIDDKISNIILKYKDICFIKGKNESLIDGKNTKFQFINEATTQTIAEIFSYDYSKENIRNYTSFKSKIFNDNIVLKSNFMTYPEYQQLFLAFLRTINGLGNINSDEELFNKYYSMLKSGEIWNRILCTYQEKENIDMLCEVLILFNVVRKLKEDSMGVNVVYNGNKEKFTNIVNEMYQRLLEQRNFDTIKEYPLIKYEPEEPEPILKFTTRKK